MDAATSHLILGTAGHIDHGKTSLVKALTGADTDWLPEEKARGMTIDIGIADLEIAGQTVGVVDVPGHERFVRTMVAGASGVDLALLVVAADDGVMPQTEEHFEIVSLLGVGTGVVALNKADLVEPERLAEVSDEIRLLLDGSTLADAPIVPVSAVTGAGITELRAALEQAVGRVIARRRSAFFRVPIDRIFSIPGRGTVVTGSMLGGAVAIGDQVELLPGHDEYRVRGLQTHNRDIDGLVAGQRTAVNLAGLKKEDVRRGMEIATPGYLIPTHYLDVEARCLSSTPGGIRPFARIRLAIGTSEVLGRLVILEGDHIAPGRSALCQLRVHEPVMAEFGQRFILRDETAARTIGGGHVVRAVARRISLVRAPIEVEALHHLASGDAAARVDQAAADAGIEPVTAAALSARTGVPADEVRRLLEAMVADGRMIRISGVEHPVHTGALDQLGERVCRFVGRFHQKNPQLVGMEKGVLQRTFQRQAPGGVLAAVVERLKAQQKLAFRLGKVSLAGFETQMGEGRRKLWERVHGELLGGGFRPPTAQKLVESIGTRPQAIKELLDFAEAQGLVVQVDKGVYIPSETIELLKEKMRELQAVVGPFSVSGIREYVDSSRRYMVPLCEYLDRIGFTRREGDLRAIADESDE